MTMVAELFPTTVLEGFFTSSFQDNIFQVILSSDWRFLGDMSYQQATYPSYGLTQLWRTHEGDIKSPLFEKIGVPLYKAVLANTKIAAKEQVNCRAFLQFPLEPRFYKGHNGIHVDMKPAHIAAVYYVNSSDGDTIIFDQLCTDERDEEDLLTVNARITPKQGSLVLFDGRRYHCSSQPLNGLRCIINFNILI